LAEKNDPEEEFVLVLNRQGMDPKNFDIKFWRKIVPVLNDCYPERLGLILIYPTGFVFQGLWSMVNVLFSERARKKVRVADAAGSVLFQRARSHQDRLLASHPRRPPSFRSKCCPRSPTSTSSLTRRKPSTPGVSERAGLDAVDGVMSAGGGRTTGGESEGAGFFGGRRCARSSKLDNLAYESYNKIT
jgi:hypothetical protein